ncbi:MAG: hypothetical protein QXN32_02815, partial [Candidatus Nitrosocaldus sp.]
LRACSWSSTTCNTCNSINYNPISSHGYHTSLLSILGYTVVWKDIDVNNAVIVSKYYEEDEDGLR